MIKETTALRKIAGLTKKIRVIQGGQGAGKTISVLILLINHAYRNQDRRILIVSSQLSKMKLTVIKDFVKIMKLVGLYDADRFIGSTEYRCPNGSIINFIGTDKEDVGKGLRVDVAYFNEANKMTVEPYRQIASRAKIVYSDFNPDSEFFIHKDVIPRKDCDFIKLTFLDNEMLDKGEREEILMYKQLGYNDKGEIINKYWANKWRVYGLGEIGSIDGAVFEKWTTIDSIPNEARLMYFGCDFGYATSKTAIVGVYNWNDTFILKEFLYANNLTNQEASQKFKDNGYRGGIVYCDSAEPKSIREMQLCGINAVSCDSKQDIKKFAIQKLNQKEFFVLSTSENLINELRYYVYDEKTGQPKKSELDHLMDALQYGVGSAGKYNGKYR
jgi:phage terminase large subunit